MGQGTAAPGFLFVKLMVDIASLSDSSRILSQLLEKTSTAYQSLNKRGELIQVNQTWLDLLGYANQEEVLGHPLTEFIVPEQRVEFRDVYAVFLEKGAFGDHAFEMLRGDGRSLPVYFEGAVSYQDGGEVKSTHLLIKHRESSVGGDDSLHQQLALNQQIIQNASLALLTVDSQGEIATVNPSACRLFDYQEQDLKGMSFKTLIHPDSEADFQEIKQDLHDAGKFTAELIAVRKSGSTFHAEVQGTHLALDGEPLWVASVRDITEELLANEFLSFRGRLWDSLMENTPDLVYFKDDDHQLIRASQAYADIFGMEAGELVGKTAADLWPHEAEEILADEREVLQGNPIIRKHRQVTTPEGEDIWFSLTKVPMYDGDEVIGFFAIDKDITEQKEAQKALRESKERFQTIYTSSGVGISRVSLDYRIEAANQKYCRMLGYKEEELVGKTISELTYPEDREETLVLQSKLKEGEMDAYHMEKRLIRKDGRLMWVRLHAHLIRNDDGSPGYFLGEIIDITERKRAQQQWEETIRELEIINDTIVAASRVEDVDEIMEMVADTIHSINPDTIVTVTLFDDRLDAVRVRAIRGMGERLSKVFDLLGGDLSTLTLPASKMDQMGGISSLYTTGKLEKVPSGIYGLTLGTMPKTACKAVERLLGVDRVYTVGFSLGDQPRGGIILLQPEGADVKYPRAIETVASHISVMVSRRQAQKESRHTFRQLRAVHEVGLQITSELELEELLERIVSTAMELVGGEAGGLNLFGQDQQALELRVSRGFKSLPEDTSLRKGEGLIGTVWQSGESLIVDDYLQWDKAEKAWADHFGHASDVGVPIYWGDEFLGVLEVVTYSPHAFDRADADLLERFATQAAIAIRNAQLYQAAQQRQQEAETLRDLGMVISSSLDESQVLKKILESLAQVISHDSSSIQILRNGKLVTEAVRGFSSPEKEIGRIFDPDQDRLSSGILRDGKGLLIDDVQHAEYWEGVKGPEQIRSWIGVPLNVKGETIGLLTVDHHQPAHFSRRDMEMANAVANQAAIALRNADLFREKNKQATQMALVNQIAQQAIIELDPEELFWNTAKALQDAFGYSDVLIFRVNQDRGTILRQAYAGIYDRNLDDEQMQPITDEGVINWVAEHGETVLINDVDHDDRYMAFFPETESELCVPLMEEGQVIGGINVESTRPQAFDQSDVLALETLADNLVAGLRTARLHEETQRRAEEFSALYDSALSIIQELDPDQILKGIRDQIEKLFHPDAFIIARLTPKTGSVLITFAAEQGKRLSNVEGVQISAEDEKGLLSWTMREKQSMLIEDVESDTVPVLPRHRVEKARSWMGVPMVIKEDVVGAISVQSYQAQAYDRDDLKLLELFASQAAVALENARLFTEANRRLKRLSSLHEIDRTITGSLDLRTTLNVLLTQLIRMLEVDAACVLTYQKQLQSLDFAAGKGFKTEEFKTGEQRLGKGLAGITALERQPVHIANLETQSANLVRQSAFRKEGFIGYHGIPLIAQGEIIGVLEVFQRQPLNVTPEWLDYLETLSGQAAIAIDRLNLFYELEQSNVELIQAYDAVIEGWSRALELRDKETEGHSSRVEDLTLRLARQLGVQAQDLVHIRRGALLHDIGKMGIPDRILQKKGELTEEEWEIMKQHPVFGYDLLSSLEYLQQAVDIPYCHHERWDGTGYPRGLEGEEIPLSARIFAVVDVWDALRSDRPYREAWSDEKALEYIREQAGKHFDPRVVEEFLSLIDEK